MSKLPARSAKCTVDSEGSTPCSINASAASSLPKLAMESSKQGPSLSNTGRTEALLQSSLTLVHNLSSSESGSVWKGEEGGAGARSVAWSPQRSLCCSISEHRARMRLPHAEPGMSRSTSKVAAPASTGHSHCGSGHSHCGDFFSVNWVATCGITCVASATGCAELRVRTLRWTPKGSLASASPSSMMTSIAPLLILTFLTGIFEKDPATGLTHTAHVRSCPSNSGSFTLRKRMRTRSLVPDGVLIACVKAERAIVSIGPCGPANCDGVAPVACLRPTLDASP
mmetsp:Transcript_79540/g.137880  ORF Transcript_79540/g.137880 Transcript_79540/m.137880 type:complete len:283 (-) Transcript_79540:33-881(-)